MGDYNINLLKHDSHPHTNDFLNIMYSNNFIHVITRPTRKNDKSGTLIDNIFTNNLIEINHSIQGLFKTDISDHLPIFMINQRIKEKQNVIYSMNRKYTPKTKINLEIWWPKSIGHFYITTKTQTLHLRCFITRFTEIYNVAFPKVKIKSIYYVRKPRLTYGLKKPIKIKNKLYAIMSRKKTAYNSCFI